MGGFDDIFDDLLAQALSQGNINPENVSDVAKQIVESLVPDIADDGQRT